MPDWAWITLGVLLWTLIGIPLGIFIGTIIRYGERRWPDA